jgi:hypothetical protein
MTNDKRNDKRNAIRRSVHYTAWIAIENKRPSGCVLSDISDIGARLDVESSDGLPDDFKLLLSRRGSPSRNCHVVWRTPNQLGVEFHIASAGEDSEYSTMPAKAPQDVEDNSAYSEAVDVEGVPESAEPV